MSITNQQQILTATQVGNLLNVSSKTVYKYADTGLIKAIELPHTAKSTASKRNWYSKRFELSEVQRFWSSIGGGVLFAQGVGSQEKN